jgi:hypothetical protein
MKLIIFLITFQALFLSNFTTLSQNQSSRRVVRPYQKDTNHHVWTETEIEEYRIIGLLENLEKGIFSGNGQAELIDAYNSTLNFLADPDIDWQMKENILTRLDSLYMLLPQELKQSLTQRLQELDKEAYEKGLAEALSQIDAIIIPMPTLDLPMIHLPTNILVQNAVSISIPRRPYSRYLRP